MESENETAANSAAAAESPASLVTKGLAEGKAQQSPAPAKQSAAAEGADKAGSAAADAAAAGAADEATPSGFVSAADVQRMIQDGINKALASGEKTRAAEHVRERFIREKMSDLPMAVVDLLPKTGDVGELAKAEQHLRGEMSAWFEATAKKMGMKKRDVSSGNPGGYGTSDAPPNLNARSNPSDLVAEGLKQSRVQHQ